MNLMVAARREPREKGAIGEKAVIAAVQEYTKVRGGTIFHSYKYDYQNSPRTGQPYIGNIFSIREKQEEESHKGRSWQPHVTDKDNHLGYVIPTSTVQDEIDVLLITPRMIIPIEVKAYRQRIEYTNTWWKTNSNHSSKNPVSQSEKHARHLYHLLHDLLPEGDPSYIRPLLCMVEESTIKDTRDGEFKKYVPVCILNNLKKALAMIDKEQDFILDYLRIIDTLKERKHSVEGIYY